MLPHISPVHPQRYQRQLAAESIEGSKAKEPSERSTIAGVSQASDMPIESLPLDTTQYVKLTHEVSDRFSGSSWENFRGF